MTVFRDNRDLLVRFRQGDAAALETVYWANVDRVTDAVRRGVVFVGGRRVSGVPAHDVLDLVQEVFTRAFKHSARLSYDGLRDYRPYLMTICRNLLADWARKRGREVPTDIELDALVDANDPETESEPWADPAVIEVVRDYVAGLDPSLAAVYEQRFARGASQAVTAATLGIGRQQIRTLEKRIRHGLAQALGQA